jgi:hypothetical protein
MGAKPDQSDAHVVLSLRMAAEHRADEVEELVQGHGLSSDRSRGMM